MEKSVRTLYVSDKRRILGRDIEFTDVTPPPCIKRDANVAEVTSFDRGSSGDRNTYTEATKIAPFFQGRCAGASFARTREERRELTVFHWRY